MVYMYVPILFHSYNSYSFSNRNILGKSKIRKKKTKPLNYYLKK